VMWLDLDEEWMSRGAAADFVTVALVLFPM
jgi:hypothetical protein